MHIKVSIYYKSNLIFQLCFHYVYLSMSSLFSISTIESSDIRDVPMIATYDHISGTPNLDLYTIQQNTDRYEIV